MINIEHRPVYVRKVMIAGNKKYDAKLKRSFLPAENPAYQPLHLGTNYNSKGRWRKKLMAREEWFKDKEDGKQEPRSTQMGCKKMKAFQQD